MDFNAIGDASFARQAGVQSDHQVYKGYVGRALITFTVRCVPVALLLWHDLFLIFDHRWQRIRDQLYKYSMEYEGGGVGDVVFSDFRMRVDSDPRTVTFLI